LEPAFEQTLPVIRVEKLAKKYALYPSMNDRVKELVHPLRKKYHHDFYALNDISFEVGKGETFGIIGKNGSGKSTLLKILAEVLTPTSGTYEYRGRLGSLLELGGGFHPELSGRKNYYLNAALNGLSKKDIRLKEKEICDFAEIGEYILQPVKTYSSGMLVRLAFSIATCIDPDILIIDEALSVGDQYFQKKSLDRMMNFKKQGKTIVFCSHDMYTINVLCNRTLWLRQGSVAMLGTSEKVVAEYEDFIRSYENFADNQQTTTDNPGLNSIDKRIVSIIVNGSADCSVVEAGKSMNVEVKIESREKSPYAIGFGIIRNDGLIIHAINASAANQLYFFGKAEHTIRITYPHLPLFQGRYQAYAAIIDEHALLQYAVAYSKAFTILLDEKSEIERGLIDLPFDFVVE
jgi:ABC-type polysaccharide/polyol phosphate transport system ATPase subunit